MKIERKLLKVDARLSVIDAFIELENLVYNATQDGYVRDGNVFIVDKELCQAVVLPEVIAEELAAIKND